MRKTTAAIGSGLASLGLLTGGVLVASSPAHAATTITFNDIQLQSRDLNATTFVRAGVDRRQGAVVGYSTMRGRESAGDLTLNATFALTGGTIHVRFLTVDANDNTLTNGRVIGGTGNFEDATGTAQFTITGNDVAVRIVVET